MAAEASWSGDGSDDRGWFEELAAASVLVVGNCNRDLRSPPIPDQQRLLQDGETSVPAWHELPGGGATIAACMAARLGARARLVAAVGDDALGGSLAADLRARGVDARLAVKPGVATGTSVALSFADGQRHFLSCLPAASTLADIDVPDAALVGCRHLYRADPWFAPLMLEHGNQRLFRRAHAAGLTVSLDINWDPAWTVEGNARERCALLRTALAEVDVAHGNITELCRFTATPDLLSALRLITQAGCGRAVVHRGAQGSAWWDGERLWEVPAHPVAQVVHVTGTGDLLSITMALLQESQRPPVERLAFANRVVAAYMAGAWETQNPRTSLQGAVRTPPPS